MLMTLYNAAFSRFYSDVEKPLDIGEWQSNAQAFHKFMKPVNSFDESDPVPCFAHKAMEKTQCTTTTYTDANPSPTSAICEEGFRFF